MTTDAKDMEDLKNLTQCSICRERYSDPRVLPCIHTFCLDCLQKAGSSRRPGDRMPCPLCRKEFAIPEEDFDGLQKDFRLQSLIEMSRLPVAIHRSAAASAAGTEDAELEAVQKVFCFDCCLAIDVRSYFEGHRTHSCCDILKAVDGFRRQVQNDEERAVVWEAEALHRSHETDAHKGVLIKQLNLVERRISKRSNDMRRLVEAHIKALAGELETLRQRKLEEMDLETDALDKHRLTLRRYRSRCERLKLMEEETVSAGDMCRLANELKAEVERLRRRHEVICIERKLRSPHEISFTETPLEGFLTESSNNVVGRLEAHLEPRRKINTAVQATAAILRMLGLTDLRVLGSGLFGLLAAVLVAAGLSTAAGVVAGLLMATMMFWMLKTLLPKTEYLQLMASLRTDGNHASGVTCLRHCLYVILQSPPMIVVYQSDAPYSRLRDIQLSRTVLASDIAACLQTNSLYVTDSGNRCVWKVTVDDDQVTKWLTDMDRPHTLSVSSDGRALLIRDGHPRSSLEVYGPDGVMVERIRVPAKIRQPHHAVETCRGTFLVSHGTWIGQTHGLVELSRDGEIVHSCNSTESLWGILKSITLLLDPSIRRDDVRHMALDADDRLFVADWFNDRIIRFESRFRLGQMFRTSNRTVAGWPILRICYVKETKQMMIVHETAKENRVHVYRIS